jgi:hypothetical protein
MHFCMKRLRTLKFFQKFNIKIKKLKIYSGWCPFPGLSNGTTLMQIQSGQTVPLRSPGIVSQSGVIDSKESNPGLLKRLRIWALYTHIYCEFFYITTFGIAFYESNLSTVSTIDRFIFLQLFLSYVFITGQFLRCSCESRDHYFVWTYSSVYTRTLYTYKHYMYFCL